eukprot:TRINITY_DN630_c0_g1_i1.p1 TRINITY_DN630_c0_g1~~TRINITY_DN630_c0_g1_i1.p1  ORF type:complete len:443 (-),score=81.34 TRINITY_DN630_c0_g1_i1:130-1458(-)
MRLFSTAALSLCIVASLALCVPLQPASRVVAAQECLGTLPGSNPTLRRWPYITSVSADSVTVQWGVPTTVTASAIAFTAADGSTVQADGLFKRIEISRSAGSIHLFSATLTRLAADSSYCYRIFVGREEIVGGLVFRTAPASDSTKPVRFIAWGDFGAGTAAQREIRDAMWTRYESADHMLALGDNVYLTGTHEQFENNFFQVYKEQAAQKALYLTPGNHDYYANGAQSYLDNFFQPQNAFRQDHKGRYFSWDWGMIHYVSVDTETPLDDAPTQPDGMLAWLEDDLSKTRKDWKIVIMHKPPYSEGRIVDNRVNNLLVPIFEKYGVQIVLTGHWHDYQRYPPIREGRVTTTSAGGVTYMISGGGGYPIIGGLVERNNGYVYDPNFTEPGRDPKAYADAPSDPVVYNKAYNFLYGVVSGCELYLEALDRRGSVFDSFTLNRCQ